MKINQNCPLILTDLFHYDISKCVYNILQASGWDVSSIESENKEKRNIQIGNLQRENPRLSKYLLNETESILKFYLNSNHLPIEDLIILQRDGCILKSKISNLNISIPLSFRYKIIRLIFNLKRNAFLYIKENGEVEVKGIRNKPSDTSFYNLFGTINFSTSKEVVEGIERIRKIVFHSPNIKWFSNKDEEGIYQIPLKSGEIINLRESSLNVIDKKDIDRSITWEDHIWPFCQSILVTHI